MADTYAGLPIAGTVSAPSVFTHPPVRRHRDARGGSAVVDAMAGDITLCSRSRTLSIQIFRRRAVGTADSRSLGDGVRRLLCRDHPDEIAASRYVSDRVIGNLLTCICELSIMRCRRPPPRGIYFDQCCLAESGRRYSRRVILGQRLGGIGSGKLEITNQDSRKIA